MQMLGSAGDRGTAERDFGSKDFGGGDPPGGAPFPEDDIPF
jgi:hypothetical protein